MNIKQIFTMVLTLFEAIKNSPALLDWISQLLIREQAGGQILTATAPEKLEKDKRLRAAFDASPEVQEALEKGYGDKLGALPTADIFAAFITYLPAIIELINKFRKPKPTE